MSVPMSARACVRACATRCALQAPHRGTLSAFVRLLVDMSRGPIAHECFHVAVCHAERHKIAIATGVGFLVIGFIGFFIKLVFIPINNIIIGGSS